MACRHHLCGSFIIQHCRLIALLHKHQVLDIAFRPFDRAVIQPAHYKAVFRSIRHGIVQYLTMHCGVAFTRQTPMASGVVMRCATGKM